MVLVLTLVDASAEPAMYRPAAHASKAAHTPCNFILFVTPETEPEPLLRFKFFLVIETNRERKNRREQGETQLRLDLASRSHVGVDGSLAALRRHPVDVLVGVLDVAGLAVHAILRVDYELRRRRPLLHPFVNRRRTVAAGGAGVDVMLGALL